MVQGALGPSAETRVPKKQTLGSVSLGGGGGENGRREHHGSDREDSRRDLGRWEHCRRVGDGAHRDGRAQDTAGPGKVTEGSVLQRFS